MTIHTEKGELTFRAWIACGFGLGFAPRAPGTVATFFLAIVYGFLPELDLLLAGLSVVIIAAVGVYLCGHAEPLFGRDAGSIVWDEFAGFAVAVWALPKTWPVVIVVFILFRLFDIAKPFPVGAVQRLRGGWGVVTDDLVAGVYANLAMRGLLALLG